MKSNLGTNIIRKISNDSNPYLLSFSEDLLDKRGRQQRSPPWSSLLPKMLFIKQFSFTIMDLLGQKDHECMVKWSFFYVFSQLFKWNESDFIARSNSNHRILQPARFFFSSFCLLLWSIVSSCSTIFISS